MNKGNYAVKRTVKLRKLKNILKDEDFQLLQSNSVDGKIDVFVLPENIFVVPSFAPPTHDNPLRFIHIRNQKCPLTTCKEKKSKLRTLTKKEAPLCIHTVLTNHISGKQLSTPARASSTPGTGTSPSPPTRSFSTPGPSRRKRVKNPKINKQLTVKEVIGQVSMHFPTLTQLELTSFVHKNRVFVEELVSNKNINQIIKERSRKYCTSCTEQTLKDWPFKAKRAYLLRHAIPIKIFNVLKIYCKIRLKSSLFLTTRVNSQGFEFLRIFLEIYTRSKGHIWTTEESFVQLGLG